jgi:hypothetical protein
LTTGSISNAGTTTLSGNVTMGGAAGLAITNGIAANITGNITGTLSELSAAQAEPGQGNPAVNASISTKIAYLYKAWRNKTEQIADTYKLYDDAGTQLDQKATVSDDNTTFTRTKVITGA